LADHKNQHFVPRCALKPFSLNGEGDAINLFNIEQSRAIQNAPVKGQCSRNYFYGTDLTIENQLAELEGEYARIVRTFTADQSVTHTDTEWLYLFIITQMHRTEHAVQRLRDFIDAMADATFRARPDQRPAPLSKIELVIMSMSVGFSQLRRIVDLKLVLLRNKTNTSFIISDNPVVLTNKFHFEKLKKRSFGLANSGALIFLPLTPSLTALLYDTDVYSIPNATGTSFIDFRQDKVAISLNELQHINADKNIYFKNWPDASLLAAEANQARERRGGIERSVTIFVPDAEVPDGTLWRRGTTDEEMATKQALIVSSAGYPCPSSFPAVIKYRSKPKTFSDGSAMGHVRKHVWDTSSVQRMPYPGPTR
jgi:uncharacterized protein DUF4238